jgi:hypothetical protein
VLALPPCPGPWPSTISLESVTSWASCDGSGAKSSPGLPREYSPELMLTMSLICEHTNQYDVWSRVQRTRFQAYLADAFHETPGLLFYCLSLVLFFASCDGILGGQLPGQRLLKRCIVGADY